MKTQKAETKNLAIFFWLPKIPDCSTQVDSDNLHHARGQKSAAFKTMIK